ncbi:palladin [Brachypodium distachyon]|uniref:Bifunctional inhibitor/plant lipid transfer protein/seed storage helical domain-containing protein n=1 Tax=Brachypodium distachyon TaxID=15368 RepID=A0A0Q3EYV4_BRADI|nr:palladin [Brachypodium distachyon]KQJ92566.1 hypothetical protein BRADI_4g44493v3 [Brachypodium distachyon]|eukprot:XP_003577139.1 palladin [Brachypodium distachyon]
MASSKPKRAAAFFLILAVAARASGSGGADEDSLRFPGFPGGRGRSPAGGYPGRVSPPAAPRGKPWPSSSPPPPLQSSPAAGTPSIPACTPAQPLPGFPGLQQPGGNPGASSSSSPADCVTPLAGLMTCASFLTGSEADTPTPQSECCSGLGMFLNSTAAVDDRSLRCLCPVILGDVNRMLPKPIDPVRMMYLPISCGVVLPPQVLFICFTGQPTPPVVSRIPDSWMTPASSALSP